MSKEEHSRAKRLVDIQDAPDEPWSEGNRNHVAAYVRALEAERKALREALTPSADTKAAYMGEFSIDVHLRNLRTREEDHRSIEVPWTTVKEIMRAIIDRAGVYDE